MRAKEWLKANGFPDISLGKGRLSNEQRTAVEAAVAKGVRIDGYTVKDTTTAPKVERVAPSSTAVADIGEPVFPEKDWIAMADGKVIGNRTVCLNCNCSLTYCRDGAPKVNIDFDRTALVTFKPRNDPNYRPRWW